MCALAVRVLAGWNVGPRRLQRAGDDARRELLGELGDVRLEAVVDNFNHTDLPPVRRRVNSR